MNPLSEKLKVMGENKKDFLNFLKARYSLFHLSNVFFRDLHYGLMAYLELRGVKTRYLEAEDLTRELVEMWTQEQILRKIDERSYMLNYPEFRKPPVKPAAPAVKPAAKPAAPPKPAETSQGQKPAEAVSGATPAA